MREVGFLTLLPGALRSPFPVSARLSEHASTIRATRLAEAIANILEPRLAALIFSAIMQERCNGEVFVTAVLYNRRSHRQQMGHVRDAGSFADLSAMNMGRIKKCAIKAVGQ